MTKSLFKKPPVYKYVKTGEHFRRVVNSLVGKPLADNESDNLKAKASLIAAIANCETAKARATIAAIRRVAEVTLRCQ